MANAVLGQDMILSTLAHHTARPSSAIYAPWLSAQEAEWVTGFTIIMMCSGNGREQDAGNSLLWTMLGPFRDAIHLISLVWLKGMWHDFRHHTAACSAP